MLRCTRHAIVFPRVRDRALQVAAVVGLVLFAINQLDVVMQTGLTAVVAAKILLTFAVPYSVSTYSALQVNRLV
ncbi:MAG TPA: nitrate/nitrite transporter NrtS [Methylomirabilota bacterium]|nr:nitrate/nitrite transporter NrtS [Methylomirabilota bacterium]